MTVTITAENDGKSLIQGDVLQWIARNPIRGWSLVHGGLSFPLSYELSQNCIEGQE